MKYSFFFVAIIVILTAAASPDKGYTITGTVSGMPDSTWLYLRIENFNKNIDSCLVINGKFMIEGRMTGNAARALLTTDDLKNHVMFWIENTAINMTLKKGEFQQGAVTGTITGKEEKQLESLRDPIRKRSDSLRTILKATKDTIAQKEIRLQLKDLEMQDHQTMKDWVKANPNSVFGAYLLDLRSYSWGKETTSALYNNLSREMKMHRYGQNIQTFIELYQKIQVGQKFVDFAQANTKGKTIKLSQVKGKYILLDFWASGCGPCIYDNRELVKTYARFKEKGFAILGVSLDDDKDNWLKRIAEEGYPWENVSDLKGFKNKAAVIYGVRGIPENYLIDEHGVIVAKNLRGKKLSEKLEQLLP